METAVQPLKLVLAGDVMTGRGIDQVLRQPSEPTLYESFVRDARDYVRLAEDVNGSIGRGLADNALWGLALTHLRRLDPQCFIVNLETAVTRSDLAWPGKGIHYRMHPDNTGCLTAAGLHGCVLANNHVLDWGLAGLDETLHTLHGAGLQTAGAGANADAAWAPTTWTIGSGVRLRLFAMATPDSGVSADWAATASRPGIALLPDLSDASAQRVAAAAVAAHQRDGAARTVVSIHWGDNWVAQVPEAQRRFAHRLIELGAADIVHGHSSHHPLPLEVHRDRLVLYGCGDLLNDYEGIGPRGPRRSDVGCLYAVTLEANSGRLQALEVVPMQLRRFRLGEADGAARQWALRQFNDGGAAFGTRVVPADGRWTLQWPRSPGRAARA
jgi:poly-gamma-glutamate synthesis protein (capsule biosynthesis protein)